MSSFPKVSMCLVISSVVGTASPLATCLCSRNTGCEQLEPGDWCVEAENKAVADAYKYMNIADCSPCNDCFCLVVRSQNHVMRAVHI
jgi:hypothetical protein